MLMIFFGSPRAGKYSWYGILQSVDVTIASSNGCVPLLVVFRASYGVLLVLSTK